MKPLLTIFTPTYNRAYTLHKCYESLVNQTYRDFVWLIIDDGSKDETEHLVESWKKVNQITIQYVYQENQGMHGAHNTAYEHIETELNVCIDSDDYMPEDAVEKICSFWETYGSEKVAGMIGLDAHPNGEILGTHFPNELKKTTLYELYAKHHVKGDKKLVYRTEIVKKAPPYPVFPGEKYCPLSYKYVLIDQEFPLLVINEVLCHVEYMEDGSSLNMLNQYKKNPRGFSFFRQVAMQYAPTYKDQFREAIHYVSSKLILRDIGFLIESPKKWTTLLATPFGIGLFIYINSKSKSHLSKVK